MANIYIGSVSYTAVVAWAALTAYVSTSNGGRGDYVRQLAAPAVGNERVFRCTTSGTSLAAEPTWNLTKNATTAEAAGPTWTECTGQELDQVSGTWKAPHARLENAVAATWGAAGDTFFVASNHAETRASSMSLNIPGTSSAPCRILCVNQAGTVPPVSANLASTATITTTGANALSFAISGTTQNFYMYGITFQAGSGATNAKLILSAGSNQAAYEKCGFQKLGTTGVSGAITLNSSDQDINQVTHFKNCKFKFGSTTDNIRSLGGRMFFMDQSTAGSFVDISGAIPAILYSMTGLFVFSGVDLSAITNTLSSNNSMSTILYRNCKIGAGVMLSVTLAPYQGRHELYNSDSSDTNYRIQIEDPMGSIKSETVLVKTGGASDGDTPLSWKMVTVANAEYPFLVLRSPEIFSERITAVGSAKTITVDILHDSLTALKDDEIWLEVQYLGTAGFPLALFANDAKADVLATGVNQTASTAAWTTTGITNVNKQKLEVTFTPQEKGVAIVTVCVAKASYTVYVDPYAVVT